MSLRTQLRPILILLCAFVCQSGCSRGPEVSQGPDIQLAAGEWSISGIRIGDKHEDILRRLGSPTRMFKSQGAQGFGYSEPDVSFVLNGDNDVKQVSGVTLEHNGTVVLRVGDPGSMVESALGRGYRVERFSPKTQGIFTVGSAPNGVEHYYRHGDVRVEVFVRRNGRIGGIHGETLAPAHRSATTDWPTW